MITGNADEKLTPKQKANEILADGISVALSYWLEDESIVNEMTQREIELVASQLKKQSDRLVRKLGYEQAWYS